MALQATVTARAVHSLNLGVLLEIYCLPRATFPNRLELSVQCFPSAAGPACPWVASDLSPGATTCSGRSTVGSVPVP